MLSLIRNCWNVHRCGCFVRTWLWLLLWVWHLPLPLLHVHGMELAEYDASGWLAPHMRAYHQSPDQRPDETGCHWHFVFAGEFTESPGTPSPADTQPTLHAADHVQITQLIDVGHDELLDFEDVAAPTIQTDTRPQTASRDFLGSFTASIRLQELIGVRIC